MTCSPICIIINISLIHAVLTFTLPSHKQSLFLNNSVSVDEIADFISSKGYLPKDKDSPSPAFIETNENDVTYFLSKLSDKDLIKLLNDQPKKNVYDLDDIENTDLLQRGQDSNQEAVFRLNNKPVDPYVKEPVTDYAILQKLNNILYNRAVEDVDSDLEDDSEKQLLFDILVAQLKTLCCKRSKSAKNRNSNSYKPLLSQLVSKVSGKILPVNQLMSNEYMFLVMNDEIKNDGGEELVSVDPDSLNKNSSVLLLGPIASPLRDDQLKLAMDRISNELMKPDYLPILLQLSKGTLAGNNVRLMKSLINGPETRRYIKPHRCNHQSPLAKVYGGPKWIVCTGYININSISKYD